MINAQSGIEVNTRRVFDEAGKAGLGRMIVINKMDGDNIDFPALVEAIRELWGNRVRAAERAAGPGRRLPRRGQHAARARRHRRGAGRSAGDPRAADRVDHRGRRGGHGAVPRGPAAHRRGAVAADRPGRRRGHADSDRLLLGQDGSRAGGVAGRHRRCAACRRRIVPRKATKDGEEITVEPKADGPLVAQVFKTRIDPFVQKLSFIRVFSGTLKKDQNVAASSAAQGAQAGPAAARAGRPTRRRSTRPGPGDIVAVAKMEELHTGTVAGRVPLPPIKFPTPMVGLAVSPKSRGDETKLSGALAKIAEEDPTFRIDRDAQTKELVMTGMSELHLTIIRERLQRRDKLEVETKEPKIPFRETIQAPAEGMYRHKKQTGGRGQFGEVHIRMFPLPRGTNIEEYATKARFPSHEGLPLRRSPQLPLGQLGRGRRDPRQLHARHRKGLQGTPGGRRDRRLHGRRTCASKSTSASTTQWTARKRPSARRPGWPSSRSSRRPARACWNRS